MPVFQTKQYDFHYEVYGTGVPFIFLHGLGASVLQITNMYEAVEGIQLICIDQRGHGQTKQKIADFTTSFVEMGEDIISFANELHLDTFFLGGISMGAAVSLHVALAHCNRIRGLFMLRTAWINDCMGKDIKELFELVSYYLTRENGVDEFKQSKAYLKAENISLRSATSFVNFFADPLAKACPKKFGMLANEQPFTCSEELKKLTFPVLLLSTKFDIIHPFENASYYKEYVPNITAYEITSKEINEQQHGRELNQYLSLFLKTNIKEKP